MTIKRPYRLILSGGGTGGHIFPAIAIANEFKARHADADILFVAIQTNRMPSAVRCDDFFDDLNRSVARPIVRDDDLQRRIRLCQCAFNSFTDIFFLIECDDDITEERFAHLECSDNGGTCCGGAPTLDISITLLALHNAGIDPRIMESCALL